MKAALISAHSFLNPGGVRSHILGLHKQFRKWGIESKIIAPRRSRKERYDKDIILLGTSFPVEFGGAVGDLDFNFNIIALERVLNKERFDVLHFHNFGFPSIFQFFLSPQTSRTLNILTFHSNPFGSKFFRKYPFFFNFFLNFFQKKLDGIIVVAPFLLPLFKNFKKPKVAIPNGIDLELFNPKIKPALSFEDKKVNILFIGRLEERKGIMFLLKAFDILQKKYKNKIRLIVVGDGPEREKCLNFVQNKKLTDVIFLGEKKENIASFYNSADIFCAPSIFGESFGIISLEAMACQKPVVAFANKGYKEFLKDKKGAILVQNRSYVKLANALETLIKNKKKREKMGKIAKKEAQSYSFEIIAKKVLDFYNLCQQEKSKKSF
jgi:phosphatidyl-myo-inositol alpha-mannosyltransferase